MSSIVNTAIAGSVAQGAHQQGQVARSQDAQRNHAARQALLLKQASEKNLDTVEETTLVSDENVIVDDDGRQPHDQHEHDRPHGSADEATDEEAQREPRVDLTA